MTDSSPQTPREIAEAIIERRRTQGWVRDDKNVSIIYSFRNLAGLREDIEEALTRARLEAAEDMRESFVKILEAERSEMGAHPHDWKIANALDCTINKARALPLTVDPERKA